MLYELAFNCSLNLVCIQGGALGKCATGIRRRGIRTLAVLSLSLSLSLNNRSTSNDVPGMENYIKSPTIAVAEKITEQL